MFTVDKCLDKITLHYLWLCRHWGHGSRPPKYSFEIPVTESCKYTVWAVYKHTASLSLATDSTFNTSNRTCIWLSGRQVLLIWTHWTWIITTKRIDVYNFNAFCHVHKFDQVLLSNRCFRRYRPCEAVMCDCRVISAVNALSDELVMHRKTSVSTMLPVVLVVALLLSTCKWCYALTNSRRPVAGGNGDGTDSSRAHFYRAALNAERSSQEKAVCLSVRPSVCLFVCLPVC